MRIHPHGVRWMMVAAAAIAAGCASDGIGAPTTIAPTSAVTTAPTTSTTSTTSTTTTVASTVSTPVSSTVPGTATTTTGAPTTTVTPGRPPGRVVVITASPGGGTGEVMVDWNAVADATGYHVDRALTSSGPFETVAVFDTITGRASVAEGVVNLWSHDFSYVPHTATGSLPDRSPWFEYVEVRDAGVRCFRVYALNAAGRSPASQIVCSAPPG